jgi:hypothetical protein
MNAPDLFSCLLPCAGWIKKEEYGNSNLFFSLDISNSFVNPLLKSILERSLSEYHIDQFISNLQTSSVVHIRVGSNDVTTHPWYSRRMFRLLKHQGVNTSIEEISGKQHWWWDTAVDNDGGVLNDMAMRNVYSMCQTAYKSEKEFHNLHEVQKNKSLASNNDTEADLGLRFRCDRNITLTVVNPALHAGYCGIQIIHQHQMMLSSKISSHCSKFNESVEGGGKYKLKKKCYLSSSNIQRFQLKLDFGTQLYEVDELWVNNQPFYVAHLSTSSGILHFCISSVDKDTHFCDSSSLQPLSEKTLVTYGPIRRVYDRSFTIVYGTPASDSTLRITMKDFALYVANSHYTSHYTSVQVMSDLEFLTSNYMRRTVFSNIIFIGDSSQNRLLKNILARDSSEAKAHRINFSGQLPRDFTFSNSSNSADGVGFRIKNHLFNRLDQGVIFTLPLLRDTSEAVADEDTAMGLVICANSIGAYHHLSRLAWPVIPPMVRAPFANYLPDFIVVNHHIWDEGFGGVSAAGFWNMRWEYDERQSYISGEYQ